MTTTPNATRPVNLDPNLRPDIARHAIPLAVDLRPLKKAKIRESLEGEPVNAGRLIWATLIFHWANLYWDHSSYCRNHIPRSVADNNDRINDLVAVMVGIKGPDRSTLWTGVLEVTAHLVNAAAATDDICMRGWTRGTSVVTAPRPVQPRRVRGLLNYLMTRDESTDLKIAPDAENLRAAVAICAAALDVLEESRGLAPALVLGAELRLLESRWAEPDYDGRVDAIPLSCVGCP